MFEKAKKLKDEKEAKAKGKSWLSEVQDEDGNWKNLQGWIDKYEPPKPKKEKSERRKQMETNVQLKALHKAFEHVQKILSTTVLKLSLEVASNVLGTASEVALTTTKKPAASGNEKVSKLLSSINTIVLSYRFDSHATQDASDYSNKFTYIRKTACEELGTVVQTLLSQVGRQEIYLDIHGIVEQQKSMLRGLIQEKIQTLIVMADTKVDNKLQELEQKVDTMKDQADEVVGLAKTVAETATGGAVTLPSSDALPTAEQKEEIKTQVKSQKDDIIVQNFGIMFQDLIIGKLESIDEIINQYIDKLLQMVETFIQLQGTLSGAKQKSSKDLNEELYGFVDQSYKEIKDKIGTEIGTMLQYLSDMIEHNITATDEE